MKDWTYSEGCGCQVTFFSESRYKTSRMLPGSHCPPHGGRGKRSQEWRDALMVRAKKELLNYLFELASQKVSRDEPSI